MSSQPRELQYSLAINEALHQAMSEDDRVCVVGQGVRSPWYVGNTCRGLHERFGGLRIMDTPVSENAVTGMAVGAAIAGLRPVVVHPRVDFMLYAFDPIINEAANWRYMSGGRSCVPVVFWGIVNRRGEQAAQHSQALHAMFAHVPGLKVVMPSNAHDAKGLMLAAIRDDNPVVFIDERELYGRAMEVPEEPYICEIGRAAIRRTGRDLTIVGVSSLVPMALEAAANLAERGLEAEVIDLRTLKPLDIDCVVASVLRTGRLLVLDCGWRTYGASAEIAAAASERAFKSLKAPVRRLALPDVPAPANRVLEQAFYISREDVIQAATNLVNET